MSRAIHSSIITFRGGHCNGQNIQSPMSQHMPVFICCLWQIVCIHAVESLMEAGLWNQSCSTVLDARQGARMECMFHL
jgi:hypothetical protein